MDKWGEFYNISMKLWLQDNVIEMYSAHNEGKPVPAETFIITLKNKIFKLMTSISKHLYINNLDDIVNKYNNTYHRTIEMKPVNLKSSIYLDFAIEGNDKDPKMKKL